jgi:hypothetical protein
LYTRGLVLTFIKTNAMNTTTPSTTSTSSTPSTPFSDVYFTGDAYLLTAAILEPILGKERISRFPSLNSRVRLNGLDNLSEPELHYVIGQYQEKYDSISNISITLVDRRLMDRRILIVGRHETGYCFKDHCRIVRGDWQLDLIHQRGAWVVVNIQIEGVEFDPVLICQ